MTSTGHLWTPIFCNLPRFFDDAKNSLHPPEFPRAVPAFGEAVRGGGKGGRGIGGGAEPQAAGGSGAGNEVGRVFVEVTDLEDPPLRAAI